MLLAADVNNVGNPKNNMVYKDLEINCTWSSRQLMPLNIGERKHRGDQGEATIGHLYPAPIQEVHKIREMMVVGMIIPQSLKPSIQYAVAACKEKRVLHQLR